MGGFEKYIERTRKQQNSQHLPISLWKMVGEVYNKRHKSNLINIRLKYQNVIYMKQEVGIELWAIATGKSEI